MYKGTTLEGLDKMTLTMRAKHGGLSAIFKEARRRQKYELVGDCIIVTAIINVLDVNNLSYSKNELYGLGRLLKEDERSATRELIRDFLRNAKDRIDC